MKTIYNTDRVSPVKNQKSKKIHYLVLWILAVMTFSCNKNLEIEIAPAQVPYLDVDPTEFTFGANETTTKMAMISTNAESWTFSQEESSKAWLTVEKSNNTLHIKPKEPNTSTTERSANITVSAGTLDPVTVKVKQAGIDRVIYNTVECNYFGNLSKNGKAQFYFNMYHSDNPNTGIRIEGFCTLPQSFEQFKLDDGNYTVASTGEIRTMFPGRAESSTIISSCFYDEVASVWTLIKGGSLTVSSSGNTATITTDLTGEDRYTGAAANVKPSTFTGVITYRDKTPKLSVTPTTINFGASEITSKTATVTVENVESWSFDPVSASWLKVEKQGTNQLNITTLSANTGSSERTAIVKVTAGSATPVEVTVKQAGSQCATYNTANCVYGGDILGYGTAFFMMDIFHSSNPKIGVVIMGFSTLTGSFSNFKIDAGSYNISMTGAVKTILPGVISDGTIIGTYLYNENTNKITLITEGSFTVTISGNTYTIAANFKGKDSVTGAIENDICISFTGPIKYINSESDIPESNYTATAGTPTFFNDGPNTWAGSFVPKGDYYSISNFFDDGWLIFADIKDGKIFLDDYTVLDEGTLVGQSGTFQFFLSYGVRYNNVNYSITMYDPVEIVYNEGTNTLDFSNKVSVNISGTQVNNLTLYIGIYAKPKPGTGAGTKNYWISDVYPDIKLKLTPKSTTSSSSTFLKNMDVPRSLFTQLIPVATKKVLMVDESQLTPVEIKKRVDTGKSFNRNSSQKSSR